MSKTTCPKCSGRMEQGFMPDSKQNGTKVTEWTEGAPQKGIFGIVRTRGLRNLTIEAWRCQRCGYLETYAPG